MIRNALESYLRQRWWQRPSLLAMLTLGPFSVMVGCAAWLRQTIKHHHAKSVIKPDHPPLWLVGNLTVGGTGKTPVVIALIQRFQEAGYRRIVVIAKGYRSRHHHPRFVHVMDSAQEVGDEPLLIKKRFPNVDVVVGQHRYQTWQWTLKKTQAEIILSDDGYQSLGPYAQKVLLLTPHTKPYGNGFCLPLGPCRQWITKCDRKNQVWRMRSSQDQRRPSYDLYASQAPQSASGKYLTPRAIHAVAAIAHPEPFFEQLVDLGYEVEAHPYPDHHHHTHTSIAALASDKPVVMTEKDWVKCEGFNLTNIYVMKWEAILHGVEVPSY